MSIELQYDVNLNKFESFSIRFERQSIVGIESFFNVIGGKLQAIIFKVLDVLSMSKFDFYIKLNSYG